MQNQHTQDLVKGGRSFPGYANIIYVRKDDLLRIQDVQSVGYILVEYGDATQDMSIYGLPEVQDVTQVETKEEGEQGQEQMKGDSNS